MCRTGDTVHIFALKTAKRKSKIARFFLVLLIVVVVSKQVLLNVGSRGGEKLNVFDCMYSRQTRSKAHPVM